MKSEHIDGGTGSRSQPAAASDCGPAARRRALGGGLAVVALGALLAGLGAVGAGCFGETARADDRQRLVVYSGRGEVLIGPLLERFTHETGIELDIRYGGTSELAVRLASEGSDSAADVFLAQDGGYLDALAQAGLLRAVPGALQALVHPQLRDVGEGWVPTSGRARVLVYNPRQVSPEELPATLQGLADPRWRGRVAWAPRNASFQAHVSALRTLWGEDATRAWLEAMRAIEPVAFPRNAAQVQAVARGEVDIAWTNHYYVHKLRSADPRLSAAIYSFPTTGDAGNLVMLSGAGVTAHTPRAALAERLVAFLLSEAAQRFFAQSTFEYPVRDGVPAHAEVTPLEELGLTRIDQRYLTGLGSTIALLRDVGLQ